MNVLVVNSKPLGFNLFLGMDVIKKVGGVHIDEGGKAHFAEVAHTLGATIIFTNLSTQDGYDTRSIFKRSLTGLNSEFSFS